MKKTIEITISPIGEVLIDAVGFKGPDCDEATKFLEEALGVQAQKVRKPEYQQSARTNHQQKVGQ
jgi:hypothetical protein